jgi:hypothetical protein
MLRQMRAQLALGDSGSCRFWVMQLTTYAWNAGRVDLNARMRFDWGRIPLKFSSISLRAQIKSYE